MYFKINTPRKDKYTDMGMVKISALFFLEEGDEGWGKYQKEHHVIVPIVPEEGYQGKINEIGIPTDQKDYDNWVASLPTEERDNPFCNHAIQFEYNVTEEERDNPFCNHAIQFEHDVTEEEILYCFEFALAQTHLNYLEDDLHCEKWTAAKVVNQDINYLNRRDSYFEIRSIPNDEEEQTKFMNDHPIIALKMEKCINALIKLFALKDVDFTTVETIASYSVRK